MKTRTWNSMNALSVFFFCCCLLLFCCVGMAAQKHTAPYGVCLRCKLAKTKRIPGPLRSLFRRSFPIFTPMTSFTVRAGFTTQFLYGEENYSAVRYENTETARLINRSVNQRCGCTWLHCLWTFLQAGCNINTHVEGLTLVLSRLLKHIPQLCTQVPRICPSSGGERLSVAAGILHCKQFARLSQWQLHLAGQQNILPRPQ